MTPNEIRNAVARLRPHGTTLLVLVIGIGALAFMANDARNQRLRAGIDDDCAQAQHAMQMYPMTRCYSIEQFLNMHRGNSDETPDPHGGLYARPEDDAAKDTGVCEASSESAASSADPNRPAMPNYFAALLQGLECEPEHGR